MPYILTFNLTSLLSSCRENGDDNSPSETNGESVDDEYLDCGKAVNFTYYDNLVGVARRHRHPNVPEPQVHYISLHYIIEVNHHDIRKIYSHIFKMDLEKLYYKFYLYTE